MQEEQINPQEDDDVEAHRWKPAVSDEPGVRAAREEDDDEVEAHRWKTAAPADPEKHVG
jgi:hypothetical protein